MALQGGRNVRADIVSYKNTDPLKHEVAFHNPKSLNPDGMRNDGPEQYFAFVKRAWV